MIIVKKDIINVQNDLRSALSLELDVFGLNDISPELVEEASEFEPLDE